MTTVLSRPYAQSATLDRVRPLVEKIDRELLQHESHDVEAAIADAVQVACEFVSTVMALAKTGSGDETPQTQASYTRYFHAAIGLIVQEMTEERVVAVGVLPPHETPQ